MSISTSCNRDEILFPVFFTIILKNEPENPGVHDMSGFSSFRIQFRLRMPGHGRYLQRGPCAYTQSEERAEDYTPKAERSMRVHTVGVFTSIPNGDRRIRSKALTSALHGDKVKQIPVGR